MPTAALQWISSIPFHVFGMASLYLAISALAYWRSTLWVDAIYANTAWFLDYSHGFVKRGLAGEMLRQAGIVPTHTLIHSISLGIASGVWLLASTLFWRLYRASGWQPGIAYLSIGFAASSATIQHLLLDAGRLDHPTLALALLAIALVNWSKQPALAFCTATPLLLVAMLIHEASFFLFMPVVLAWWIYRHGTVGRRWYFLFLAVNILAMLSIAVWGVRDIAKLADDFAQQQARAGGWLVLNAYAVVYRDGLLEIAFSSLQRLLNPLQLAYHLEFLVFGLLPQGYLYITMLKQMEQENTTSNRTIQLLYCSALGACALYGVAVDYFRWWAWVVFHGYLITVLLCLCDSALLHSVAKVAKEKRYLLAYVTVTSLMLGGMGADNSYPLTTFHTRWGSF